KIKVVLDKDLTSLYIKATAWSGDDVSEVVIKDTHTNIVLETVNGIVAFQKESDTSKEESSKPASAGIRFRIKEFSISQLVEFVDKCSAEDLLFINDGIEMNL